MPVNLVVPINLQALCVGAPDVGTGSGYGTGDFADIAADFSQLPYLVMQQGKPKPVNPGPNFGEAVLPQFFQPTSAPLQQGVHLHWTLPAALAHGVTGNDGTVSFRSAPNRWLVVRIASNHADADAPTTALKAWVVESDLLWEPAAGEQVSAANALSRAMLLNPPPAPDQVPNRPYLQMGFAYPYEIWQERFGGLRVRPFTALGYGALAYAAAYPQAPNVFGLYDTLDDLDLAQFPSATTNISYAAAGWYADSADDPLAQLIPPLGATYQDVVELIARRFGWTFAPEPSQPLPDQIICNGIITGISWNPNTQYLQQPASAGVAVGNTTAEALSALLANQPALQDETNVEGVLNALQLGLLNRIARPDGMMQIEEAMHQAAFGATDAGTLWVIKPVTPGNRDRREPVNVTGQDLLDAAGRVATVLPQGLGSELNLLNVLQQQADDIAFRIQSYRRQIFADWYKYMMLAYGPSTDTPITYQDAFSYIKNTLIPEFNDLVESQQGALMIRRNRQIDKLRAMLGKDYLLDSVRTPRYWAANDPVVLLSGPQVNQRYRPFDLQSYSDGNLICRLDTTLLTAMDVTVDVQSTVTAAQLPQLAALRDAPAIVAALVAEAFFVDPAQCWVLAAAATATRAAPALWQRVRQSQQALYAGTPDPGVTFRGTPPAPLGFQLWSEPWVPLLLEWEVAYYPWQPVDSENGAAAYPTSFITNNFRLDDDAIDLVDLNPPPLDPTQSQIYQGLALLARNTAINIIGQINGYLADYPDDPNAAELTAVATVAADLPVMAQAMGGFNSALAMRRQTLQLAVSDPLAFGRLSFMLYEFSNQTMPPVVGAENTSAPLPNDDYNPLRAGLMRIQRLWLVDMFGQKLEIAPQPTDVICAASLIPTGDDPLNPYIGLRPRFAQPSRLMFRWLSAADDIVEMNSDPATTPICGWVLFNHVDQNLMIYDAAGRPLGSLNLRGPGWTGAPGDNATFGEPIEVVFADQNPHLRNFALGIYNNPNPTAFLADFLAVTDRTMTLVNPENSEQFQALSVLIGRPLALARASLALDLAGLPVLNQSWAAFTAAVQDNADMGGRDDAEFPAVQWPVRLGDLANVNDGLIGYFIDDGSIDAYRTFYAPASLDPSHGVVPPGPDQLTVAAGNGVFNLSMLIDPRAAVHATAGFVPVKEIRIPPYMFADAIRAMAVTFLTTPVLSAASRLAMPIPKERGYDWSLVSPQANGDGWTNAPIAAVDASPASFAAQLIREGWLRLSRRPHDHSDRDQESRP